MTQEFCKASIFEFLVLLQLRSLAGVGWQHDLLHFKAYGKAIVASAQLLLDPNLANVNKRELSSSRMLLQSFLKSVSGSTSFCFDQHTN